MKVEFINPFIKAATEVLKAEAGLEVIKKGQLAIETSAFTSQDVTVMIGVTGKIMGIVLYGMSEKTAKNIVSHILHENIAVYDNMVESAIAEMGNVITGIASAELEKAGYPSVITPPTVISGRGVIISTIDIKRLVIPLITAAGEIVISVALVESQSARPKGEGK